VTWGSLNHGGSGDSLRVTNSHTRGIKAIPEDHSLGMVPVSVREELAGGVEHIASTTAAFVAIKGDGSLVAWGDSASGGDCRAAQVEIAGRRVQQVFNNLHAFAALTDDGCVVTWGSKDYGGDCSRVKSELSQDVEYVYSTWHAFAAVKKRGQVVVWGHPLHGGDDTLVATLMPAASLKPRRPRSGRSDGTSSPLGTTTPSGSRLPSPQPPLSRPDSGGRLPPRPAGSPEAAARALLGSRSAPNLVPGRSSHKATSLPRIRRAAPTESAARNAGMDAGAAMGAASGSTTCHGRTGRCSGEGSAAHQPLALPPRPRRPTEPANNDAFWASVQVVLGHESHPSEAQHTPSRRLSNSASASSRSLGRRR